MQDLNKKIKTKNLLLSGDSWLEEHSWYQEIFDSEQVTNLAVSGSGNKYIAESVMSHIVENPDVDHVFVNWTGLNRIDIPLPLGIKPEYKDAGAIHRTTSASRYWTNHTAPFRDRNTNISIEERLIRLMYQEKGYTSVKNQALIHMINLQDFLKVRQVPYLFCFMYDYGNSDFDHNHLTGEAKTEAFSNLGSVDRDNPFLRQLDRSCVLEPAGIDWALRQPMEFQVMKDAIHLTEEGYRAWARAMLRPHNFTKSS